MKNKIEEHFDEIGGVTFNVSNQVSSKEFEHEINILEEYFSSKINNILLETWFQYNGQIFKESIGIEVKENIPIWGDSKFIDFGRFFSIVNRGDNVFGMIKSNDDIFNKHFLPFSEALEGDFFAYNIIDKGVYYILHDFNENEKPNYKVSDSVEDFFLSLKRETKDQLEENNTPKLVKEKVSSSLLDKLKKFKKDNP